MQIQETSCMSRIVVVQSVQCIQIHCWLTTETVVTISSCRSCSSSIIVLSGLLPLFRDLSLYQKIFQILEKCFIFTFYNFTCFALILCSKLLKICKQKNANIVCRRFCRECLSFIKSAGLCPAVKTLFAHSRLSRWYNTQDLANKRQSAIWHICHEQA